MGTWRDPPARGCYYSGMSEPAHAEPLCKRILALLIPTLRPEPAVCQTLESAFGPIEYKGDFFPFDCTDYYREEFGPELYRGFLAFRGLDNPGRLPDLKLMAAGLENTGSREGRRVFNLDIGYMDADKVVLASYKRGACKLYLRDGVYADFLMKYAKGRFEPMPWAFADFRDGRYEKSLLVIREKLKSEQRRQSSTSPGVSQS
jgi:hypothetical protein